MKSIGISLACIAALLAGCESKAGTGALAGAGLGATTGALLKGTPEAALIGGAIGAAAGGLVGAALDEQDRKTMQQRSPSTLRKIDRGQQLSLNDIKAMSQAGINDNVIISQINSTGSVFHLTTSDIIDLKNSGVSQRVIDAMIQTG